ncbi:MULTISPECIES: 3-deoxy-7-phosphoheptulonate synthase [Streptosporangium]|uniref:Phospho-2-dehydro-3-deoxyheptonate aldolase n=1 Tax=Streptosporangium brasiliense TaxID=47480 RepID=A0ABT9RLL1_9ACTN|nr:3-deoxy-7-phosphoheptulonate synthase [Streptosporangium brasiliense]MDP9870183.1 3-deoxy-7-phosphoheptulonate synthase [Streptosporangium brasiliense]
MTALTPGHAPQQPDWSDPDLLDEVRRRLAALRPLVTEEECARLAESMGRAGDGRALVLQGGDCAERFRESNPCDVGRKLDQLYHLARGLGAAAGVPVVPIGRLAGQYGKPRSEAWERVPDGTVMPAYRGDAVNSPDADPGARFPDPLRLLRAYECAERVLATVRASWEGREAVERAHVSHEALLLDYEHPLARQGSAGRFASSAHSVWIGDRTRSADGPHVAFAASITNPIGLKIGPSIRPADAVRLSRLLNPEAVPGRLTFIVRMGSARIRRLLPEVVGEVARRGTPVVWLCDPMHGNTMRIGTGRKTRPMGAVLEEVGAFVRVLRSLRRHPAGLHLEMTPEDVTECVPTPLPFSALPPLSRYRTACDPRLNAEQAAEVVERFVSVL